MFCTACVLFVCVLRVCAVWLCVCVDVCVCALLCPLLCPLLCVRVRLLVGCVCCVMPVFALPQDTPRASRKRALLRATGAHSRWWQRAATSPRPSHTPGARGRWWRYAATRLRFPHTVWRTAAATVNVLNTSLIFNCAERGTQEIN